MFSGLSGVETGDSGKSKKDELSNIVTRVFPLSLLFGEDDTGPMH